MESTDELPGGHLTRANFCCSSFGRQLQSLLTGRLESGDLAQSGVRFLYSLRNPRIERADPGAKV